MYVPLYHWENGYKSQQNKERTYIGHILLFQFTKRKKKLTKYLELRPETCPVEAYFSITRDKYIIRVFQNNMLRAILKIGQALSSIFPIEMILREF